MIFSIIGDIPIIGDIFFNYYSVRFLRLFFLSIIILTFSKHKYNRKGK